MLWDAPLQIDRLGKLFSFSSGNLFSTRPSRNNLRDSSLPLRPKSTASNNVLHHGRQYHTARSRAASEVPVTPKPYQICTSPAFGGIFFGYDTGYIYGVVGMEYRIETF